MFNLRITDGVKNLIIINVLVHFGSLLLFKELGSSMWALGYPGHGFQPYQIVTHMFAHADIMHIAFNMWMLFLFGPPLETLWGVKRFLLFYFLCGFGALAAHTGVEYYQVMTIPGYSARGVLGASGAIMGVAMAFGLSFPNLKLQLLFPPIPVKALHFVLFLICADLFFGFSSRASGVAHFAHLGGALMGYLIWEYWRKFGSKIK